MKLLERIGLRSARIPKDLQLAPHKANSRLSMCSVLRARRLGTEIRAAVENRESVIKAVPGIDESFALPAANWDSGAANDYLSCYKMLASLTIEEMHLLRFRSQNFTGNNLPIMGPGAGTSGTDFVCDDFESKWSEEKRHQVISHWHALTNNLPSRFILNAPNIMGECGWWYKGRIVNVDMNDYQERISLMFLSEALDHLINQKPRILEIGGGYGALCLGLQNALRPSQYVICDLPESLLFSGLYLTCAARRPVHLINANDSITPRSNREICLLPNYLAQVKLPAQQFDLVINTLSMSEMSPHQVETYAALISNSLGATGMFFEQNHNNKHVGLIDCRDYLPAFFRMQRRLQVDIPKTRGEAILWSN